MGFGCWGVPPARGINLFALQCAVWVGVMGTCAPAGPAKGALAWATQNPQTEGPQGGGEGRTAVPAQTLREALSPPLPTHRGLTFLLNFYV